MGCCGFVSFQHLLKTSYDVVKRWVNEAQEAASSDNIMVQVGHSPPPGEQHSSLAWSKLLELSQAPLGDREDERGKNHSGFVMFSFPVQYHALGLLYHVRKNDRLAVNKMLSKFTRHGLKSPFAYCLMIRIASKLLEEEAGR